MSRVLKNTRPRAFPETRHSVVRDLGDRNPDTRSRAFASLVAIYWRPVYTYLRLYKRVDPADAEDLTQGFFAQAFESGTLDRFDPSRARFRTFVRTCLDGYVANQRKAAGRLKRGGGYNHVALDFQTAEGELVHRQLAASDDVEAFFHREWMRELVSTAVSELRDEAAVEGRETDFAVFERYDLDGPDAGTTLTYAAVARELGVPTTRVTNALHSMRRRFRERVLARLRSISASDEEFREESRMLFQKDSL